MPMMPNTSFILLTALSLSVGWGIRGNFGHEYGAMIAGALAAMAACLLSGRADWQRRVAYFACFGALGWSFGGSMSYGHVIAYTHSGDLPSVTYGFASLFVIGFLWGAMGGAGTALPACLDRDRLTQFFVPLIVLFVAWTVQDVVVARLETVLPARRHESWFYWHDTDWVAALVAIVVMLGLAAVRRRLCSASSLILHMAIGWWVGFGVLVLGLDWHMTPPRSDSWAGALGMTVGLVVYLLRHDLKAMLFATLVSGFVGGLGFSLAVCIKLAAMNRGWQTNWHSVMEQTYGFINGLGIAVAMGYLAVRLPRVTDERPVRRWTDAAAVFFVLIVITYVNLVKNAEEWVKQGSFPETMYGLGAETWFNFAYLLLAGAAIWLLWRHLCDPLPLVPAPWLGKGQLLYIAFLWWMVVGNFERALSAFQNQRLITEGVIFANAVVCTVLLLVCRGRPAGPAVGSATGAGACFSIRGLFGLAIIGLAGTVIAVLAETGIVRGLYGDAPAQGGKVGSSD